MNPDLLFMYVCGLVLIVSLPIIGLTFLFGILAVRNNWSLKLALGITLSMATLIIFLLLWLDIREIWILILGIIISIMSAVSAYSLPPMVFDSLNILFTRLAHIKTQEEQK